MGIYRLYKEQFLPISIELAWDFFSNPLNLAKITPPTMEFKVLTQNIDSQIYNGMEIDYIVKPMLGIPLKWKTLIGNVQDKYRFSDSQLKGPYKLWEHTHTFVQKENGVLMIDSIDYQLPMGFLGDIAHSIFVRKKLDQIFDFRKTTLEELFK